MTLFILNNRNRDLDAINSYHEDQYHEQFRRVETASLKEYTKTLQDFLIFLTRLAGYPIEQNEVVDIDGWLRLEEPLCVQATELIAAPTMVRLHTVMLTVLKPFAEQPAHNQHPVANFVKFSCHMPAGGFMKISGILHMLVHLIHAARLVTYNQMTLNRLERDRREILQMIRIQWVSFAFLPTSLFWP